MSAINCSLVIEIHALTEEWLKAQRILLTKRGRASFEALVRAAAAQIVEELDTGGAPTGADEVKVDGSQLLFVIERNQKARTYRLVITAFNYRRIYLPITADGLCLVHGPRTLVERLVVYCGPDRRRHIELVPDGIHSDERKPGTAPHPLRAPSSPALHRTFASVWAALLAMLAMTWALAASALHGSERPTGKWADAPARHAGSPSSWSDRIRYLREAARELGLRARALARAAGAEAGAVIAHVFRPAGAWDLKPVGRRLAGRSPAGRTDTLGERTEPAVIRIAAPAGLPTGHLAQVYGLDPDAADAARYGNGFPLAAISEPDSTEASRSPSHEARP
jgi:hypothetical protein